MMDGVWSCPIGKALQERERRKLLIALTEVLKDAENRGYAVAAFNANNMEYVQGIIDGAKALNAPVIIQASPGAIKYAGLEYIVGIVKAAAQAAEVPVVLHLDHGKDLDIVKRCLDLGFTSVMIDGSRLPIEDNIKITKEAAELAHAVGASAEGEIGHVPEAGTCLTEDRLKEHMTKPEDVARFVAETNIDAVAVAVGSVHGMKSQGAELDIERLKSIRRLTKVPLVLHGSSGVTDASIVEAIRHGVRKINVATALNVAFSAAVRSILIDDSNVVDPRKYLGEGRAAVTKVVQEKIALFMGEGLV